MKYLIWLLVILLAIWAFKRSRRDEADTPAKKQPLSAPANMLTCRHCGIHLPQDEAVAGEQGPYCSTEHRSAAQDRHPAD